MKTTGIDILVHNSILSVMKSNMGQYGSRIAVSYKKSGVYLSLTYEQFYERILMHARGLAQIGVKPGNRVAIFSENRLGWVVSDLAIQACRAVTVPIYATDTGQQAAYVINHSEADIVFVSTRGQYEKLLAVRDQIPRVRMVIAFEQFLGDAAFPVYSQFQLSQPDIPLSEADRKRIEADIAATRKDDLLTIIYTSGTTGQPKGVLLTQGNFMSNVQHSFQRLTEGMDDFPSPLIFLSFLPLSHVFERMAGFYTNLIFGNHVAFAENTKVVIENINEIRPDAMVAVPRLFEKLHSRVYDTISQASPLRRALFHRAVAVGGQYVDKKYIRQEKPGFLAWKFRFFDKLVFTKIRQVFGGRLKFMVCGGAPLDETVTRFMWSIGVPVFNGYGLTETSPVISACSWNCIRFGAVGKVINETEVKIAEDGELLIRGPQLMQGYYKNEEANRDNIEDGWFKTGDIGRIDEDGFLYIIDRKKELIVTAGGKNIAPQPIEGELRLNKYIEQAFVYGDRKPYLVALLTPNIENLIDLSRELGIQFIDINELVSNQRILEVYQKVIDKLNGPLPQYSTIKKFALLANDFTVDSGEITSTLKLKRKVIYQRYQALLDGLYTADHSKIDVRTMA